MQDTNSNIIIKTVNGQIHVLYSPMTDRTIYDICDLRGRVIKTGVISDKETTVDSSDLFDSKYVMLIVDGDRMFSKPFEVAA